MARRAFFIMTAAALAVFVALNLGVAVLCRNTVPRQIARRMDHTPVLNCLALGNSLMQAGFDEASFESTWAGFGKRVKSLNAGLGSSYPVEHLVLLHRAFQGRRKIDCLFYGFFDFQLTTLPPTAPGDLIGNRAMLYYFEPAIVPAYYRWPASQRLLFNAMRLFPAIEERGVIWEKVEKMRRGIASLGMAAENTNRFGRVRDFALLESESQPAFIRECDREIAERQPLSKPIGDMIRFSKGRGSRVVMIEMPMHPSHQSRYYSTEAWRKYRVYLQNLLAREGASYIQASDWIDDEKSFADHLHVSGPGADAFSRKLAVYTRDHKEAL